MLSWRDETPRYVCVVCGKQHERCAYTCEGWKRSEHLVKESECVHRLTEEEKQRIAEFRPVLETQSE